MKIQNVADLLVHTLAEVGVKRIYGVVGDSLNGVTEALRVHGGIQWVGTRHEEVAAFAASGESQVTGELAVCAGSCGPGKASTGGSLARAAGLPESARAFRQARGRGTDRERPSSTPAAPFRTLSWAVSSVPVAPRARPDWPRLPAPDSRAHVDASADPGLVGRPCCVPDVPKLSCSQLSPDRKTGALSLSPGR